MEDQTPTSPGSEFSTVESAGTDTLRAQPGAQAVEALVRAIAQEFVVALDEFHNRLLDEEELDHRPKVQAAGS